MSTRIAAKEFLSVRTLIMTSSLLVMAAGIFVGERAMSIEMPDYTVVYTDGDVEYRQYAPYLVAETVVAADGRYKDAGNEGFRRLFRYITGGNTSQTKIAMTAPVEQSARGEKISMTAPVAQASSAQGWVVSFMVPGKYSIDTVPQPTDPRVRIRQVPGEMRAVLGYSGRWTEKLFRSKVDELDQALAAVDVAGTGEPQSALYNPPYTPPFMRRNEVQLRVESLPVYGDVAVMVPPALSAAY
jgi:hypothetical protein